MNDIRYVCLSDLHLGAENSLLTRLLPGSGLAAPPKADPTKASEVLVRLADCLRFLVSQNRGSQKPTLILNGDVLELALADVNVAAMVFERFMDLTMKPGDEIFDKTIYYNPGNHDHHLWESARETQYVEKHLDGTPWGSPLDPPWHTTNMLLEKYDPVPCYLLNRLVSRTEPQYPEGTQPQFFVVYPNLGVLSPDRKKCVIFSHGHYIESIYRLMSTFRSTLFPKRAKPNLIWNLESENFAWIDFFWSTLGRSGDLGADIELIYDKLQSDEQLNALVSNLADGIGKKFDVPWVPEMAEHKVLAFILRYLTGGVAKREVKDTSGPLSRDAQLGLRRFIETFVLKQIQTDNNGVIPDDVTFIFGHTHKPFEQVRSYSGFGAGVKIFNNGGWVVDSVAPDKLHGGALILVDDALNTASIRIYNDAKSDSQFSRLPFVSEAVDNPLVTQLKSLITAATPWKEMTEAIFAQIPLQRENLTAKIQSPC